MPRPWSVTKSRRLEAAEACSMMASSDDPTFPGVPANNIDALISAKPPTIALARAAFNAVGEAMMAAGLPPFETVRQWWAEAECLLRGGWTPGDQILMMRDLLEAKADAQVEAQHDAMNAAGVPAGAENVETTDEEKPFEGYDQLADAFEDEHPSEPVDADPDIQAASSTDDLYTEDPPTSEETPTDA